MPILKKDKDKRKREAPYAVAKSEIEQKREDEESNLSTLLDYASRLSRAGAGVFSTADPTEGVKRAWQNVTGERKDDWAQNIANLTGADKDSLPVRAAGFIGDATLDPLNFVGVGPLVKAGKGALHGASLAAKAGKLSPGVAKFAKKAGVVKDVLSYVDDIPKNIAEDATKFKALFSNYAGLNDAEKAIVQLYDAKKHSLDDLAKEATINALNKGKHGVDAIGEGTATFKQMLEAAQNELKAKTAGMQMSPDFAKHVGKRLGTVKVEDSLQDQAGRWMAKVSQKNNPLSKVDRSFKLQATRYNPLFYMNNAMGNVQQTLQEASSQGVRGYGDAVSGFLGEYGKRWGLGTGIKGYDHQALEALGRTRGVKTNVSSIYKGKETGQSLAKTLEEIVKTHADEMNGNIARKAKSKTTKFLDKAQYAVEGKSRQAAFNAYFKQGLRKGLSEADAADEAALRVTRSLFDYEDVTGATRALRSMPVVGQPFITWAAKNIPRQAGQMITNPQYASKVAAATRAATPEDAQNQYMPDYNRERGSIALGKYGDLNVNFNPALTLGDVNQLPFSIKNLVTKGKLDVTGEPFMKGMHPLGKSGVELFSNEDQFTGNQISDENITGLDRLTEPQPTQADLRWLMEQAPELFSQLGATRAPSTGNPQAPYWLKKAAEYPVALRSGLRAIHSIMDPENATDKTPFGVGSFLPIDMKTDKQLKVAKEFEDRKLAKKVRAERKVESRPKRRLKKLSDG